MKGGCSDELRLAGKPYPRTCVRCGLGPCVWLRDSFGQGPHALKRAERQPITDTTLFGGVWVKSHLVPDAGTVLPQHAHTYDHISYVAAGSVTVQRPGDIDRLYTAPEAIRIRSHMKHRFITHEPNTVILCIHNAAHGEAADIHEEHHLALED